jgi:DNA-binding winged helix-turn-helix (wHTH) protein/tetratricopeptide (TPR) repeat protein
LKNFHQASSSLPEAASGAPPSPFPEADAYAFGPFRLYPEERLLRRGNRRLPLPPKAFETLLLLIRNPGHLMLKEDLMKALWPDTFVEEVNLANKISLLRKVMEDTGPTPVWIETVPKLGYRFLTPVTHLWKSSASPGASVPPIQASQDVPIRFIALPFTIRKADEAIAFLGHSLPEAISCSLAGLRALIVRSSRLADRLAETDQDPRRIAQEAEVDMLLAGSILSDGDTLRVTTELIQAPTGTLVGSYVCHAQRDRIFEIQDNVVRRILDFLAPQLTDHESRALSHDVPTSARAYEFYLRGAHIERQRSFENMSLARDLYRQSLEEDPDYAPAWARLGRCYHFLEKFDPEGSSPGERTEWAFRRAFALNPELPLAHNCYTQIEADSGHAERAMVRLLGQSKKTPNDPELFSGLVQATRYCGLLEESLRAHQRARTLDPRAVTSVAHTYFLLGDYRRTLEWYPPGGRFYLDTAVLAAMGREAEAHELLAERASLTPLIQSLRCVLAGDLAGNITVVRSALVSERVQEPEVKFYLARHLARGGAEQEALDLLCQLTTEGFVCSTAMKDDPWLKGLARLPGFDDVMRAACQYEVRARLAFQAADGDRILSTTANTE